MFFRILHLTDFHWDNKRCADQQLVVDALLTDLQETIADKKPNVIVVSGDLVQSGSLIENFLRAEGVLLQPLLAVTGLNNDNIIICPGNNDVDRGRANEAYIETGLFNELVSKEKLNTHIDNNINKPLGEDVAMARMSQYFDFVRGNYHKRACFKSSYVDCLVDETTGVGFASFNTAWRSTGAGDADRHRLLLGERTLDIARKHLEGCITKIAVLHHPLEWLPDWDRRAVQIPLYESFDVVLFGHVHEGWPTFQQNPVGECIQAQGGCIYEGTDYYNGYQLIDIGLKTKEYKFTLRTYFPRIRKFGPAEDIVRGGLKSYVVQSDGQKKTLEVRDLISLKIAIETEADAHVAALQPDQELRFDEVFICPPLSTKRENETYTLAPNKYKDLLLPLDTIIPLDGITVVNGTRESGKSMLGLKVAKICADADSNCFRIPVLIDFSTLKSHRSIEKLTRRSMTRLEIDVPIKTVIEGHRCIFIVDNVILHDTERLAILNTLISGTKTDGTFAHDWLIIVDDNEQIGGLNSAELINDYHKEVFIHALNRSQVRSLVNKIQTSTKIEADSINTLILKLLKENKLPRTAYMVTLLAYVFSVNDADFIINEANLVDKMIDMLLKKHDTDNIVRHSTDFAGQNIILEEAAFSIYNSDGFMMENDFIEKMSIYLKDRGIKAGVTQLYEKFIRLGILERKSGEVRFRYRAFESFFLSKYAMRHMDMINDMNSGVEIIKLQKEYSFICDLSRHDHKLLSRLEELIQQFQPDLLDNYTLDHFLAMQKSVDCKGFGIGRGIALASAPKTHKERDDQADLQDRLTLTFRKKLAEFDSRMKAEELAYVRDGEPIPKRFVNTTAYFALWGLWGRALSSLDFVELSLRRPSLDKLLKHWCVLSAFLVESGVEAIEKVKAEFAKDGREFPTTVLSATNYIVVIGIPASIIRSTFAHIGNGSVSQLILESFDEHPIASPQCLPLALLLIIHRPHGWHERIARFVNSLDGHEFAREKARLLLETLTTEIFFATLSKQDRTLIEKFIGSMAEVLGASRQDAGRYINRIEQDRTKIKVLTKERI